MRLDPTIVIMMPGPYSQDRVSIQAQKTTENPDDHRGLLLLPGNGPSSHEKRCYLTVKTVSGLQPQAFQRQRLLLLTAWTMPNQALLQRLVSTAINWYQ